MNSGNIPLCPPSRWIARDFVDACRTCRGQFEIPEKSEKKKNRASPILSYTHPLPTTYSITICHTLKAMTLKVIAKISRLAMTKERALTVAQTETPSLTEMRALPLNQGLLCRTAHESYVQSYRRSKVCYIWIFCPVWCWRRLYRQNRSRISSKTITTQARNPHCSSWKQRRLEPAADKLDHHVRSPPALCEGKVL